MNNYPFQKKNNNNFNLNKRVTAYVACETALRDYQENVSIGQTHGQTDGQTDRRQTKLSLCAAMLRRRHKNHNT